MVDQKDILQKRVVSVGSHEVRLEVHPFLGFRTYVDGVRVTPKKGFKLLERKRTLEVSLTAEEPHQVVFELEFQTRGSWECTIRVDGKQVRQFEDAYLKDLDWKQRLKWVIGALLIYAALMVFVLKLIHR